MKTINLICIRNFLKKSNQCDTLSYVVPELSANQIVRTIKINLYICFFPDSRIEPSNAEEFLMSHQSLKQRRLRNRWFLLITLLNNPSLKEFRRPDKFQHKSAFMALNIMVKEDIAAFVDGTMHVSADFVTENRGS